MKESMRNCFHIIMMPIWRRKYFLISSGIVWALFYVYLHYMSGDNIAASSSVNNVDISLSTGSLSAKLPVDMALVMPGKEFKQKITSSSGGRRDSESSYVAHASSLSGRSIDKAFITSTNNKKHSSRSKIETSDVEKQNFEETRKNVPNRLNSSPPPFKSLKQQFSESGIKPTSIIIKPRTSAATPNATQPATKAPPYIPALRLVHFDLKGAPPKLSYFKSIFPLLKVAGANGIIMEYEDTFPFWGPLSSVPAYNAYKKRDIQHILELAKKNQLQVIPLVQTFGHLEFVLKLREFKHLREVEEYPQALCPTNNGSLHLVQTMIDQVMSFHRDSKWLHIGSDEVFQLGQCRRCSRYERNSLFLAYVKKVAKYVREHHKVIPIMWDDMLRHISVPELEKYELGKLVEPMAWSYVEDVYMFIPDSVWEKYSQVFPHMWTASAFKGAFGETLTVPDAKRHLQNNEAWLYVMKEQNSNFAGFRGIAITGWQRYDHFAALCELLPASLPSLILNILTVSKGLFDETTFPAMQDILDCSSKKHYHLDLEHDPFLWRALGVCFFPGSSVFRLTLRHSDVTKTIEKYIYDTTVHKGWLTEYNVNHNFTSPMRVNELMREFSYHNSSLQMLLEASLKALREVFDEHTVNEWVELNIYPYVKKMNNLWDTGLRLKAFVVWPRRPFPASVKLPPPSSDFVKFVKS